MAFLKLTFILFAFINLTSLQVGAQRCTLQNPGELEVHTFDDSTPGGVIVGLFTFPTLTDEEPSISFDEGFEYEEDYFNVSIHTDPVGIYVLVIQTTDLFSDILDIQRVDPAVFKKPSIKYSCSNALSSPLPQNWEMELVNTNNQAPQFSVTNDYIEVDLDVWKTGAIINQDFLKVVDLDFSVAHATVNAPVATWVGNQKKIVEVVTVDAAPVLEEGQYVTKFNLTLAEDVVAGNYTIRLDVTDKANNRGETSIYVHVSSGIQNAGAILTITLAFLARHAFT